MPFRFAQMTDTHLYMVSTVAPRDARDAFLRGAIRECASHGIDFIVHTGDFVSAPDGVPAYVRFRDVFQAACDELGIGLHFVRGNHDTGIPDAAYREVFGPSNYGFRHKEWAFVGIDRYYKTYEHTQHAYCLSADSLDEVSAVVEEIPGGMPLIAMVHDDPVGISRYHRGPELLRVLRRRDLRLLLFGHVHAAYLGGYEGIPFVTVTGEDRAHDTSPLSYNIVTCNDDGTFTCDFHPYTVNLPAFEPAPSPAEGPAARPGGDWPTLRGPAGTRSCDVSLPDEAPGLAWRATLPGRIGAGGLTLAGGRLFAGTVTRGRPEQCGVVALDAVTGEIAWEQPADGSIEGGLAVYGNRGYAGTSAGSLLCLDVATGDPVWTWNNRDNMPIACQPVLADGRVHCGANWEMYAVDAGAGSTLWRKIATSNGFTYMGPGNASPLALGGRIYHQRTFNAVEEGRGLLQSVDAATGLDLRIAREHPAMHPLYRHASPMRWGEKVLAAGEGVIVVDPAAPDALEWIVPHLAPASATPAMRGDVVVVSYHDEVAAYHLGRMANIKRALWRTSQEPARFHFSGNYASKWGLGEQPQGTYSAPLLAGHRVIACGGGGHVRCLGLARGEEHWRLQVDAPILGAPLLSGNVLYVGDYDGVIHAFTWG